MVVLLLLVSGCQQPSQMGSDFRLNFQAETDQVFAQADRVRAFQFPIDHGPHETYRSEWWYLTSLLRTDNGRLFGCQFTLFRQALTAQPERANDWQTGQVYLAHFAVADIQREQHLSFERLARGHPQQAGVTVQPFRAFLDNWELKSTTHDFAPLQLNAREEEYALSLELTPTKPIVLHGDRGWSRKGPKNHSYYYSIPRMRAVGTLRTPEDSFAVTGTTWLDREWMTDVLADTHLGWVWFSLQLDNGEDVVLFRLRSKDPAQQEHGVGLFIDNSGKTQQLDDDDWSVKAIRYWHTWPVEWSVRLFDRTLQVRAAFDDQLMTTHIRYWEGVVFVEDGKNRIGEGYLELTGY